MSTDIGVVKGLIELQDDFTSEIGLAKAALSNFSKENQESLKAVAGAAGLVTAAVAAVGAAVLALGNRGADVNDLNETLEHFSGSASAAAANMEALRAGTKGTVDNFVLAKDAAQLLSAGVKLTANDFGTLGSAAFVLQNRGLGGTKEMLDLVSDAMVTGRTRALAMKLGVIDAGDAEENYAKKLGITKDQLTDTGKAEAHRVEVMNILNRAVKDAGNQERDFGEQLEAAKVVLVNWMDDLASAVASSKVLTSGMKALGDALQQTFAGSNKTLIQDVVHWIEQAAIMGVNFGLAAIEMARVIHIVWASIETVILGTIAIVLTNVEMVTAAIGQVAKAGAALKIVPDGAVTAIKNVQESLHGMNESLVEQSAEVAKGVFGHSEFDKTLDKLGGTLYQVKDAMTAASKETAKGAEVVDIAAKNARVLAAAQEELNKHLIDTEKVQAILIKSTGELSAIWDDYFALTVKNSGTAQDQIRAQIEATFNKQIAALDALDPLYNAKYQAYRAVADEALNGIAMDWDSVKNKSIESLNQQAEAARNTYDQMVYGTLHFTREALEEQLQKVHETADAARGMGAAFVAAEEQAKAAAMKHVEELKKIEEASKAAAKANRELGGSFTYDLSTEEGMAQYKQMNPVAIVNVGTDYFKKGGTLESAIKAGLIMPYGNWVAGGGGNGGMPHAASGGTLLVGEKGPEIVKLPIGSTIFPNDDFNLKGRGPITNHFHVNGTAEESAKKIFKILMDQLKSHRQFGAA